MICFSNTVFLEKKKQKKNALNAYNTCTSIAKVKNLHTANVVKIIVFV